jgi:beta-glucosidase
VKQGLLPEARLNDALLRVMRVRFRLGEFDPPARVPYSKISPDVINSKEHRELALKAARESIVLLKNEGNLLPLDKSKLKKIAVIGPHADLFTAGGYSGRAENPVKPIDGIRNRAGAGVEIVYAKGAQIVQRRNDPPFDKEAELKKAVDAAKSADVAIVYVGTTLDIEAEGRDRTSLALPGNQEELIEAVMAANPKTIVVEMNAGPLCVPWIAQHVPSILEAWWGGEEGGNAMADVIFGNTNPAGRLPLTVYASESQVPPQDEYDVTKGFTYMYLNGKPLYSFGHGLSYTKFEYSDLDISPKQLQKDGNITVRVKVKNTGSREGEEVPQLYVHEVTPALKRPAKQLRAFSRQRLSPGEEKLVTFTVPAASLAYWDEKTHGFVVKPGAFDVMVGASSDDVKAKGTVEVKD